MNTRTRNLLALITLVSTIGAGTLLCGCDREVAHETKVKVNDGEVKTQETTVTETSDGNIRVEKTTTETEDGKTTTETESREYKTP